MSADAHDRERHSDLAVLEANEYKQKRRLERILDAHDHVEDASSEAFEAYALGEISEDAKNIVLLQAVKKFIREVYQLLREHEQERLRDDEDDSPGYLLRDAVRGNEIGRIQRRAAPDVVFYDLQDFLQADTTYYESWEEPVSTRHGPNQTQEFTRQHSVPEEVSWQAYLLTTEFLTEEHSLELQFEELKDTLPTWGFEEVPDEEGTEVLSEHYDPEEFEGSGGEVTADGDD